MIGYIMRNVSIILSAEARASIGLLVTHYISHTHYTPVCDRSDPLCHVYINAARPDSTKSAANKSLID